MEFDDMDRFFADMASRAENVSPALEKAAGDIGVSIGEAMNSRESPFGEAWAQIKESTQRINRASSGISRASSGRLRASLRAELGADMSIDIKSSLPYANAQNFGNPNNRLFGGAVKPIPARPFSPISPDGRIPDSLREKIDRYLFEHIFGEDSE